MLRLKDAEELSQGYVTNKKVEWTELRPKSFHLKPKTLQWTTLFLWRPADTTDAGSGRTVRKSRHRQSEWMTSIFGLPSAGRVWNSKSESVSETLAWVRDFLYFLVPCCSVGCDFRKQGGCFSRLPTGVFACFSSTVIFLLISISLDCYDSSGQHPHSDVFMQLMLRRKINLKDPPRVGGTLKKPLWATEEKNWRWDLKTDIWY